MSGKTYDFVTQLKKGQEMEYRVCDYFSGWVENIRPATMTEQRQSGIDFVLTNYDGTVESLEVKVDYITTKTGNVFVETLSNSKTNKLGWANTSKADILAYVEAPDTMHLISMPKVKDMVTLWRSRYGTRRVKNKTYQSEGIPVPLSEFMRHTDDTVVLPKVILC